MTLQYATEFSVDYYDPYALITIADNQQYLLVPEGETVPVGLDTNITVLQQPFQNLYVAASSAMDLFDGIGANDQHNRKKLESSAYSIGTGTGNDAVCWKIQCS